MNNRTIPLVVVALLAPTTARANPCELQPLTGTPWPGGSVDVWVTNTTPTIAGLGTTEVDTAVRRSLSTWTEQSGTALKLNYRGFIAPTDHVDGAILIKGVRRTGTTCNSYLMDTFPFPDSGGVHLSYVVIDVYDLIKPSTTCVSSQWHTDAEVLDLAPGQHDFITDLEHELGHGAFDLQHSDVCSSPTYLSIMHSGGPGYAASRTPREWDQFEAQLTQGRRTVASTVLMANEWNSTSWVYKAGVYNSQRHRFASLTQNYAYTVLPFNYKPAVSQGANDRVQSFYFASNTFSSSQTVDYSIAQHPLAVAIKPLTAETMVVYEKNPDPHFTSDNDDFCYVRSTDGGQTYGTPTCTSLFGGPRYGVTVAYDPTSDAFVAAVAQGNGLLYFYTLPATGSSTPTAMTPTTQYSWHAPSIACKSASYGCRIAFEDHSLDGCLEWDEARINTSTGHVEILVTRSQCWQLYDTPSIAYYAADDTFRLAFQQGNGAAYAETMSSMGTSWTGMPDIWNSPSSAITSPVLATESFCFLGSCTYSLRGWLLKFEG